MDDIIEFITCIILPVFGTVALVIAPMLLLANLSARWTCGGYGEVTGLDTKVIGIYTCMIEDPEHGWMTYKERYASRIAERVEL
jgi:hypothetical protein